jgi:hypothetical protein
MLFTPPTLNGREPLLITFIIRQQPRVFFVHQWRGNDEIDRGEEFPGRSRGVPLVPGQEDLVGLRPFEQVLFLVVVGDEGDPFPFTDEKFSVFHGSYLPGVSIENTILQPGRPSQPKGRRPKPTSTDRHYYQWLGLGAGKMELTVRS